ncbi:MAG: hypothetical protein K6B54_06415 [Clostridia bacterium]|nr:hypothetical protein [Clostridia bacterium]
MRKAFARFTVFAVILFICVGFITIPRIAGAAESVALYDTESKKSSVDLSEGMEIELQFKVSAKFNRIGFFISSNDSAKELELSLYKWKDNVRGSKASSPIAQKKLSSWTRNAYIYLDLNELGVGSCDAGEYVVTVYATEGKSIRFFWYDGNCKFSQGYVSGFSQAGSPMATIDFVNGEGSEALVKISKAKEQELVVPEEYVIPEDHPINTLNVDSTQWVFVDGLGRSGVTYSEAGNKNNKKVGIFYWTWHYNFAGRKPLNVQKILNQYPEAANDYNHKAWNKDDGPYFWNEPIWGYYSIDRYVMREQAELLADAGVDFVLFDCTNQDLVWEKCYMVLLEVWEEARQDGVKTPQIGFMLPFWDHDFNNSSLQQLYKNLYMKGLYQDLWFYLDGKPFIMAIKDSLDTSNAFEKEISEFFTFRRGQPDYFTEDRDNTWFGWLHKYPQAVYRRADGSVESTTVGVAMNADYTTMKLSAMNNGHNMGRGYSYQKDYSYTYTYKGEKIVCNSAMENAYYYGINFQEQWDFALSVDPDIVFVTGWNEWIAGRNDEWQGVKNGFPDQYNDENSRDIEPSKGNLKDYYYYQLVNNVRKYKGMSAPADNYFSKTIDLGDFSSWNDAKILSFNHYANNTYERDNVKGWGSIKYSNPGIRNDFVQAKAVNDEEYIYFYVKTASDITSYTDENWMRLLIDTGAATKTSTDWEEFEYIVGRETGTSSTLSLEKSKGGWNWEKVSDVSYNVSANEMAVAVKKSDLGLSGDDFTIAFKWADGNLVDGNVLTLYTDGDAAPGGRFAFAFSGSSNTDPQNTPRPAETGKDNGGSSKKSGCGGFAASLGCTACLIGVLIFIKRKEM